MIRVLVTAAAVASAAAALASADHRDALASPELPALAVGIGRPGQLTTDGNGGVYLAAPDVGRILHVDREGRLTVTLEAPQVSSVAWSPAAGLYFAGGRDRPLSRLDPRTGSVAPVCGRFGSHLEDPAAIAVLPDGRVYVADRAAHRIYRCDSDGALVTVAGDGVPGYLGDDGDASQARLSSPEALASDGRSRLYVADRGNHCVRAVDLASNRIRTVVGDGLDGEPVAGTEQRRRLRDPSGIAVDHDGNLYVSDLAARRVFGVEGASGRLRALDLPPAIVPRALVVEPAGALLVADIDGRRLWRRRPDGRCSPVAGNGGEGYGGDGGPALEAFLVRPTGLARDRSGNLYVADEGAHRVRRIDAQTGRIDTVAGTGVGGFAGDGGPAVAARLDLPTSVAIDGHGRLAIADTAGHRVRLVSEGGRISTVAGTGADGWPQDGAPASLSPLGRPSSVAFDGNGRLVVVQGRYGLVHGVRLDTGAIDLLVGSRLRLPGLVARPGAAGAAIARLQAFAMAPDGDLFFEEEDSVHIGRVRPRDASIEPDYPGVALPGVRALCSAADGDLYAAGVGVGIVRIAAATREVTRLVTQIHSESGVAFPVALACGDDGVVFFADTSGRVRRMDRAATVTAMAGGGLGF